MNSFFVMTVQVHCYLTENSNTFYLFLFPSRTNIRLFGSYFSVHELSHLKSLYFVLLVMFLIYFFRRLFDFFFSFWFSLILNSWLVGNLKCHTPPPWNPWGTQEGGGKRLYSQETSMKIVKASSQLTLSYCSLFTLNKRNMT